MLAKWLAATLCLLLSALSAWGDELPSELPGIAVLSVAEVQQIIKAGQGRLVDVRPLHDHLSARIPGSLHVTYRERSARATTYDPKADDVAGFLLRLHKFLPEQDALVVFYCNGLSCWKSYKAAIAAQKDGYTKISWFRAGIAGWESAGFPVLVTE